MAKTDEGGGQDMTPQQAQALQKFKKSAMVSQQTIPNETTESVHKNTQVDVEKPLENESKNLKVNKKGCQTYFSYDSKNGGKIEIDLITFREKGVETRYLSILAFGYDPNEAQPEPHRAFLSISDKEGFENIKSFFDQLNWED